MTLGGGSLLFCCLSSRVATEPDAQPNAKRGPIGRLIAHFEHGFDLLAGQYRRLIG